MRSDLQPLHDFNASQVIMREAVEAGLIDWTFGAATEESIITPATIEFIEQSFEGSTNSADLENAGKSPKSIRFRESSRGRALHPETIAPYSPWCVELARFAVPTGTVGVVKGFEQYLAQMEELQQPGFVYTQNARWGIPGPWHSGLANEIIDPGVWNFRLHGIQRSEPAWWQAIGPSTLPDMPYTDFSNEPGLWWPAGCASCQNIHLVVPAGFILRVFYSTPAQAVRLEVAAKLKGFIQSDRTPESALNVRTNY